MFFVAIIPSAGDALREADRARTLESKIRVWRRSIDVTVLADSHVTNSARTELTRVFQRCVHQLI